MILDSSYLVKSTKSFLLFAISSLVVPKALAILRLFNCSFGAPLSIPEFIFSQPLNIIFFINSLSLTSPFNTSINLRFFSVLSFFANGKLISSLKKSLSSSFMESISIVKGLFESNLLSFLLVFLK